MSDKFELTDDLEGMSEEELFSFDTHDKSEAEKITAPRYSYWKSVFRIFFKKTIYFKFFFLKRKLKGVTSTSSSSKI